MEKRDFLFGGAKKGALGPLARGPDRRQGSGARKGNLWSALEEERNGQHLPLKGAGGNNASLKNMSAREKRLAKRRAERRSSKKCAPSNISDATPNKVIPLRKDEVHPESHGDERLLHGVKETIDDKFRQMHRAFLAFDREKSGKVEPSELYRLCQAYDMRIHPEQFRNIITSCETDSNGHVYFLQFADFLRGNRALDVAEWQPPIEKPFYHAESASNPKNMAQHNHISRLENHILEHEERARIVPEAISAQEQEAASVSNTKKPDNRKENLTSHKAQLEAQIAERERRKQLSREERLREEREAVPFIDAKRNENVASQHSHKAQLEAQIAERKKRKQLSREARLREEREVVSIMDANRHGDAQRQYSHKAQLEAQIAERERRKQLSREARLREEREAVSLLDANRNGDAHRQYSHKAQLEAQIADRERRKQLSREARLREEREAVSILDANRNGDAHRQYSHKAQLEAQIAERERRKQLSREARLREEREAVSILDANRNGDAQRQYSHKAQLEAQIADRERRKQLSREARLREEREAVSILDANRNGDAQHQYSHKAQLEAQIAERERRKQLSREARLRQEREAVSILDANRNGDAQRQYSHKTQLEAQIADRERRKQLSREARLREEREAVSILDANRNGDAQRQYSHKAQLEAQIAERERRNQLSREARLRQEREAVSILDANRNGDARRHNNSLKAALDAQVFERQRALQASLDNRLQEERRAVSILDAHRPNLHRIPVAGGNGNYQAPADLYKEQYQQEVPYQHGFKPQVREVDAPPFDHQYISPSGGHIRRRDPNSGSAPAASAYTQPTQNKPTGYAFGRGNLGEVSATEVARRKHQQQIRHAEIDQQVKLVQQRKEDEKAKRLAEENAEELRLAKERAAIHTAFLKEQEEEKRKKEEEHKRKLEEQVKAKKAQKERERRNEELRQKQEDERLEREREELQQRYEAELSGNGNAHTTLPATAGEMRRPSAVRVASGASKKKNLFGDANPKSESRLVSKKPPPFKENVSNEPLPRGGISFQRREIEMLRQQIDGAKYEREDAMEELRKLRKDIESQKLKFESELSVQKAMIDLERAEKQKEEEKYMFNSVYVKDIPADIELPVASDRLLGSAENFELPKIGIGGAGVILSAAEEESEYNANELGLSRSNAATGKSLVSFSNFILPGGNKVRKSHFNYLAPSIDVTSSPAKLKRPISPLMSPPNRKQLDESLELSLTRLKRENERRLQQLDALQLDNSYFEGTIDDTQSDALDGFLRDYFDGNNSTVTPSPPFAKHQTNAASPLKIKRQSSSSLRGESKWIQKYALQ